MSRNAIRLVAREGKIRYTKNEYDKGENEYIKEYKVNILSHKLLLLIVFI
mgnify:CR=1 FL=1